MGACGVLYVFVSCPERQDRCFPYSGEIGKENVHCLRNAIQKKALEAGVFSDDRRIAGIKLVYQGQTEVELVDSEPLQLVTSIFNDISGDEWRSLGSDVWPRLVANVEVIGEKPDQGHDANGNAEAGTGKAGSGAALRDQRAGAKRLQGTSIEGGLSKQQKVGGDTPSNRARADRPLEERIADRRERARARRDNRLPATGQQRNARNDARKTGGNDAGGGGGRVHIDLTVPQRCDVSKGKAEGVGFAGATLLSDARRPVEAEERIRIQHDRVPSGPALRSSYIVGGPLLCKTPGCERKPRYGVKSHLPPQVCVKHKTIGMIRKDAAICEVQRCERYARFNVAGEKGRRRCTQHEEVGMVGV